MKYSILLFDADMTLLDFIAAEKEALKKTMADFGHIIDDDTVSIYSEINDSQWKLFEKGLCTKPELIVNRFRLFLDRLSYSDDPAEVNRTYAANLATFHPLLPDAKEVCEELSKHCRLFMVTNGIAATQRKRFAECGLAPCFENCFISEEVGYQKPLKEFFDHVANNIRDFDPSKTLVIGDSLTSDMQGGVNAGLDTCWFNASSSPNTLGIPITYEIQKLTRLFDIVDIAD